MARKKISEPKLSPQAKVLAAAYLQTAYTRNPELNKEVYRYARYLLETVGTAEDVNKIMGEIGI